MKRIIHALKERGYETYIVGGAVRDILLGKQHIDYDLVTFAQPDEVKAIALSNGWVTINVGKAFGVIVVVIDGISYEVATARTEWYGEDSHRPAGVHFANSIDADLARRDFTVNAMAMDIDGRIIDPFGGQKDLEAGIIRTVGSAEARFKEDALRMFRAGRFAAQLGFKIDSEIIEAVPKALYRTSGLSLERVRNEIEKILIAPYAQIGLDYLVRSGLGNATCKYRHYGTDYQVEILPELLHLPGVQQNPRYHYYDVWGHTLEAISWIPADITLRWAALLHDIAKGLPGVRELNDQGEITDHGHDKVGAEIADKILTRLQVSAPIRERVVWLLKNHMIHFPTKENVVRWLKKRAKSFSSQEQLKKAVSQLVALRRADIIASGYGSDGLCDLIEQEKVLNGALATIPFYVQELKIKGGEIAKVLGKGPQVSRFQQNLLERVIAGQLPNRRDSLLDALSRKAERIKKKEESAK